MKINAVTNRGSKKDFSDLLLLHEQEIPLPQSLDYSCNGWSWDEVRGRMRRLAEELAGSGS